MTRKSQIFIFDLIFASIMIFVSLGLFFTYFSTTTDNSNIYTMNYEILNSISKTGINSLNDIGIRDMFKNGYIKNKDNTVAQQIAEFVYINRSDLAQDLTQIYIKNYISRQMNYNITLSNSTFTQVLYQGKNTNVNLSESTISSSSNRIIIGFLNKDSFYGPYTLKITIWQ